MPTFCIQLACAYAKIWILSGREKRVRFPKGRKKSKPEELVEEDTVARRRARDAASERARLRNQNTASLFVDDDGVDDPEERYEVGSFFFAIICS